MDRLGEILAKLALLIVKPETVIKWHRQGFRLYWRWKSKASLPGRPRIDAEIRNLIHRLSEENPLWGTPRIQAELHLLGLEVAESAVAKYRIKSPKPSSQTWKTFLSNHAGDNIGIDFFTVPTATFRNLYCFIILLHEAKKLHFFRQNPIRPIFSITSSGRPPLVAMMQPSDFGDLNHRFALRRLLRSRLRRILTQS